MIECLDRSGIYVDTILLLLTCDSGLNQISMSDKFQTRTSAKSKFSRGNFEGHLEFRDTGPSGDQEVKLISSPWYNYIITIQNKEKIKSHWFEPKIKFHTTEVTKNMTIHTAR